MKPLLRRTAFAFAGALPALVPALVLAVVFGVPWPILVFLVVIYAFLTALVFHV